MSSEQPYGRAPIPSSTMPYTGSAPPSNSMPYNAYPVSSLSKTQDLSIRGGFPPLSVSKPNQDPVPNHALFSPEPLPVLLPVRIPESHPVRVVTPSQPPPMDHSPSTDNKTSRRGERVSGIVPCHEFASNFFNSMVRVLSKLLGTKTKNLRTLYISPQVQRKQV